LPAGVEKKLSPEKPFALYLPSLRSCPECRYGMELFPGLIFFYGGKRKTDAAPGKK
jgi:hypothetical protein